MSDKTATSLFISSPLASKYAGLYQDMLNGFVSHQQLGNQLVQLGEQAHAFRQFNKVREIGQLLSNIPIKDYQAIGHYFEAVATNRMGSGDQDKAQKLFELVVDTAPRQYKAKAILSLAAISAHKGDFDSELRCLMAGLKISPNLAVTLSAYRGIAIVKAKEGYHNQALKDLEQIQSLMKFAPPLIYFDYLNSYAVELSESGRKEEARNIIKHVVVSPFAFAYPEWLETARELKEPNRSLVTVPPIKYEPVKVTQHVNKEVKANRSGRVISFPPLKEAPEPKRPDPLNPQTLAGMTLADKKEFILSAVRTELLQESEYDRFIYLLGLMNIGPASDVIDLEDKTLLHNLVREWCYTIDPEELAGVMSALRDCKEDWRRESIMDDMISFAYQQTPAHLESESAWRRKVERRLPEK